MVHTFPTHVTGHMAHIQSTPLIMGLFISIFALVAFCAKRATKSRKRTYVDNDLITIETEGPKSPLSTPKRLFSNISNLNKAVNKKSNEEIVHKENEAFGEGGLWQKNILMGEKWEPLEFSGVIYYDKNGKRISEIPRSHRFSNVVSQQQGGFSFPISS